MSEHVYRVVIDAYPTPDGKPFDEQEQYADDYDWPSEWPDEESRWYRGEDGYLAAPTFRGRRFFSLTAAQHRVADMARYGVSAHIDRAAVGDWQHRDAERSA
ncbi:hypothetical protein HH308_06175 [Gordonia sp. TBRC 11910]|uniref:Uncharacterized protein n=1 Tax=Gordonia asplenii TaxID=2725283 RepID=A0A848KZC2_9ACTN|nr:hypothetical protein [Gordonia asplenii]NMO00798.1 hypothetical protein [Gordonia asplenii]